MRCPAPSRLAITLAAGFLALSACGSPDAGDGERCGWDTSTPEGQAAMNERLDVVATWLAEHQGEPPPPIDSPFWLGECPTSTQGPPIHEDEWQGADPHGHE